MILSPETNSNYCEFYFFFIISHKACRRNDTECSSGKHCIFYEFSSFHNKKFTGLYYTKESVCWRSYLIKHNCTESLMVMKTFTLHHLPLPGCFTFIIINAVKISPPVGAFPWRHIRHWCKQDIRDKKFCSPGSDGFSIFTYMRCMPCPAAAFI